MGGQHPKTFAAHAFDSIGTARQARTSRFSRAVLACLRQCLLWPLLPSKRRGVLFTRIWRRCRAQTCERGEYAAARGTEGSETLALWAIGFLNTNQHWPAAAEMVLASLPWLSPGGGRLHHANMNSIQLAACITQCSNAKTPTSTRANYCFTSHTWRQT